MTQDRLSRLWGWMLRRSPAQHHAALSRRLRQAKSVEDTAAAELRRLQSRRGETRATRRADRTLRRLSRRTDRLSRLVSAARPFVAREY